MFALYSFCKYSDYCKTKQDFLFKKACLVGCGATHSLQSLGFAQRKTHKSLVISKKNTYLCSVEEEAK